MSEIADESIDLRLQRHDPGTRRKVRVAAAVIWREGRVLFTQRPPRGALGLQWELPGGKIEDGETPEHAVVRELHEELGVRARAIEELGVDSHDYLHGLEVEIHFIACELESYVFQRSAAVHDVAWWTPGEIDLSRVLAGDRDFVASLRLPG
jgi:8-oxo-dGTP diphosphatase